MSFFCSFFIVARASVLSILRISYTPDRYTRLHLQRKKKANVCNACSSLTGGYSLRPEQNRFPKLPFSWRGLELFE